MGYQEYNVLNAEQREHITPTSRLATCITLTKELDGITVIVPDTNPDLTMRLRCRRHRRRRQLLLRLQQRLDLLPRVARRRLQQRVAEMDDDLRRQLCEPPLSIAPQILV